jgi:hypothetical protein
VCKTLSIRDKQVGLRNKENYDINNDDIERRRQRLFHNIRISNIAEYHCISTANMTFQVATSVKLCDHLQGLYHKIEMGCRMYGRTDHYLEMNLRQFLNLSVASQLLSWNFTFFTGERVANTL